MGKRKVKPFISKTQSRTYHVVHRSQRDPLAADADAAQHVLVEKVTMKKGFPDDRSSVQYFSSDEGEDPDDYAPDGFQLYMPDQPAASGAKASNTQFDDADARSMRSGAASSKAMSKRSTAKKSTSGRPRLNPDFDVRSYLGMPDDGYDYERHMRVGGGAGGVFISARGDVLPVDHDISVFQPPPQMSGEMMVNGLPADVFASAVENPVGMLNLAAPINGPRPDIPQDVLHALAGEEDAGFDELEDDFIALANAEPEEGADDKWQKEYEGLYRQTGMWIEEEGEGEDSDVDSRDAASGGEEETGSRKHGTASVTSSVARYRAGLNAIMDDKFEVVMTKQYEDHTIGELSEEQAAGKRDLSTFDDMFDEFLAQQAELGVSMAERLEQREDSDGDEAVEPEDRSKDPSLTAKPAAPDDPYSVWERKVAAVHDAVGASKITDEEGAEQAEQAARANKYVVMEKEVKEQWDCETILTTYSNTANHPGIIRAPPPQHKIRISHKTGIPLGVLGAERKAAEERAQQARVAAAAARRTEAGAAEDGSEGDEEGEEQEDTASMVTVVNTGVRRPTKETPAEKKARKEAVKLAQREAREKKKAMKMAFKNEELRQIEREGATKERPALVKY